MRTRRSKRAGPPAVTRTFLEALTGKLEDAYRRVLDAISLARRKPNLSLTKAAKASGTTLTTMRKYAASALEVRDNRLEVTASDRLPRRMRLLTPRGEFHVLTRSSRVASLIGDHSNAIRAYRISSDPSGLRNFEGKSVTIDGQTYELLTDRPTIDRFIRAGAVHFVDIYAIGSEG
jgi:hypothetical protein